MMCLGPTTQRRIRYLPFVWTLRLERTYRCIRLPDGRYALAMATTSNHWQWTDIRGKTASECLVKLHGLIYPPMTPGK